MQTSLKPSQTKHVVCGQAIQSRSVFTRKIVDQSKNEKRIAFFPEHFSIAIVIAILK